MFVNKTGKFVGRSNGGPSLPNAAYLRLAFVQPCALLLLLLLAMFGSTAPASGSGSAIDRLQRLQTQSRRSRARHDWRSNLAVSSALQAFLNGDPDVLLDVARAELRLGRRNAAIHTLMLYARMGQSTDLAAASPDFTGLEEDSTFAAVRARMRANATSISRGSTVFVLGDARLLAEDIDYDPTGKRFYITSVREKKIETVDRNGRGRTFADAPDGWPMVAVKVDAARGVVWATEVAMPGLRFAPRADWGKSVVLCYSLRDGKLLRRIAAPRPSGLDDMLLTSRGDVFVSDGDGGGVYRATAQRAGLERIDRGDFISPQTAAISPDNGRLFVPDYERGIGVLDLATRHVRWVPSVGRFALDGIDGIYIERGRLFAVQNGTSPKRIAMFAMDSTLKAIRSQTILERTPGLDPTHGVFIDGFFYYIANSGWGIVDERGDVKPGATMTPPRIMRVRAS